MPTIESYSDPEDEELLSLPLPPKAMKSSKPVQYNQVQGEQYKKWNTIYPIYIDSKRTYQAGRKVSKVNSVAWPLAKVMASACAKLGLQVVYEVGKTHPQDWANPGRCKVLLKDDNGRLLNSQIKDRRNLLIKIAVLIAPLQPVTPAPTLENPNPLPPISLRLPENSPAISHGGLEGGGMAGMMAGMLGGGEEEEEPDPAVITPKKKIDPRLIKPRRIHVKR